MKDLTVDVGVLMAASRLGAYEYFEPSLELAQRIVEHPDFRLALDGRKRIEQQYRQKMRQGTFGHTLLVTLATRQKIALIPWSPLDKATKTGLREAHFDPEDYKYVETAAATDCRILVSHDPHYSTRVCRMLRRPGVKVMSANDALNDP